MQKNLCILIFLLLFSTSAASHQPERGRIHATLGPYVYKTLDGNDYNAAPSPLLGGFGLVANGDVDKNGSLEIAMIYMHKMYYRRQGPYSIAEKIKRLQMTLGYRHWFNEYFSVAGAYYSAYAVGDPTIIHSDFSTTPSFTTSASDISENGFDFSLQWEFHRTKDFSLVIDIRYALSISESTLENADHAGILIGYKKEIESR